MRYIIADIHGCYNEYINLLKKINFSDNDILYILGDVVDRGPEPIKILQDMMKRSNVFLIIGNHEFMMYTILKKLAVEITSENCENYLDADDILKYNLWLQNGGYTTLKQFSKIVVHNQSMKKVLMKKGISEDSMVTLKMFDYLIKEGNELPGNTKSKENNIIIAGKAAAQSTVQRPFCVCGSPYIKRKQTVSKM